MIVGTSGESAMDTGKYIALLLTNGGAPARREDFGTLRSPPLPVIAVPTTAGTGSEVSPSAIITHTERHKKMNRFDPRICPRVALVDPDLRLSMPPARTAATGVDALSHAVDSLHCRPANPPSDALALEGARVVAIHLRRAVRDGGTVDARCAMAQASLTAGLPSASPTSRAATAWPVCGGPVRAAGRAVRRSARLRGRRAVGGAGGDRRCVVERCARDPAALRAHPFG